eukprot:scaffold25021_cov61-Phaeocystis_antarctica.AAC.3
MRMRITNNKCGGKVQRSVLTAELYSIAKGPRLELATVPKGHSNRVPIRGARMVLALPLALVTYLRRGKGPSSPLRRLRRILTTAGAGRGGPLRRAAVEIAHALRSARLKPARGRRQATAVSLADGALALWAD